MNRIIELLQEIFSATEEQTKSFTDAMKAKKIYTASEENLDVRYGKLKEQAADKDTKLKEALAKIATLESGAAGSETIQQDLTAAQTEIATLKAQLAKAQVEGEARVALLAAGAKPDDIGYLMYTLQDGENLEQDEKGKVKGLDDKITALKTNKPGHFIGESKRKYQEQRLPTGGGDDEGGEPQSLADALRMQYEPNDN
jgi:hypothetical protein